MPTRSTYLAEDESVRLAYVAERFDVGIPTLIRLSVKLLLDDPLPDWGQAIVDELRGVLDDARNLIDV